MLYGLEKRMTKKGSEKRLKSSRHWPKQEDGDVLSGNNNPVIFEEWKFSPLKMESKDKLDEEAGAKYKNTENVSDE
uniref:Uncharacterized protein n=1 Tax=Timema poppense TaxID=170557 RepID=A0A7R9DJJ5_TIMPO|nr:unnamed protein product [Timema poppensis]